MEKLEKSIVEPKNPVLHASRNKNLPHSPGVRAGNFIFLSGMVPIDPRTGQRTAVTIRDQVRTTFGNMQHMLESAGSSMQRVVRIQLVLADHSDADTVEDIYREFFPKDPPARTTITMQLRGGNGCEIECWALAG